jgi:arylformamidase
MPVDQLPLETLIGPAIVAFLPDAEVITADELRNLHMPAGVERLLLRTRNSELWAAGVTEFRKDYVALTADAARWLVDRGVRLVAVDYLSVQRYQDGPDVHKILLAAGVIILEGLNLTGVAAGEYELICLPVKIIGAEGAPARAVLVKKKRE